VGIIRDSFVIFKNWAEAINALPEEYQLETYKALVAYGTTGEIPKGLSPVANAMLISFSAGMENSILRYNASVENGKKGGRPPKNKTNENQVEPSIENDNPSKPSENLEKPNKTQENLTEPTHNLNDNVNVIKLVKENNINNNKNAYACYARTQECERVPEKSESERRPYLKKYENFFEWCFSDKYRNAGLEIIDAMIEARAQADTEQGLVFNQNRLYADVIDKCFSKIGDVEFQKIAQQLAQKEDIQNRPAYTLGCLLAGCKCKFAEVECER